MRSAIALRNIIGEAQNAFMISVVPPHRDFNGHAVFFADDINRLMQERLFRLVKIFDEFLQANGDPALNRLVDVDGDKIFPHDPGTLPNREGDLAAGMDEYVRMAERGITPWDQIPTLPDGLRGLEKTRRIDLEDWMDSLGLNAVLFPTVADVGPADADVN